MIWHRFVRDRRMQGIVVLLLSAGLSLFLVVHSLVVQVDFDACFGNYGAAINGERPYRMVGEMSFGELIRAAHQQFSRDQLLVAVLGLLPLSPFAVAWSVSKRESTRMVWVVSALVGFVAIAAGTFTSELADFYDCDLNGVGLGIVFAPILYMAIGLVVTLALGFVLLAIAVVNRA